MVGLLSLVFLAAVVGIFKPYIKGMKRVHFVIAAIASIVLVGIFAPPPKPGDRPATASASTTPAPAASGAANPSPTASPNAPADPGKWDYSEDKDEMRGTTARFAAVDSENEVDLDFPYGVVRGRLWVRRRAEDGLNVMFSVEKGQVLCHSFGNSYVSVKFDDGPIQRFRCTGSSDGSSETAFLTPASKVLAGLRTARRTIVEAEFYQQGRKQFIFETRGLNWK